MRALLCGFAFLMSNVLAAEIRVTDYLQRQVVLASPAKRIVALAPHIVENVFAAGGGSALVGAVDYSDYPPEAEKIPRVGAISAFSIEAIVAAKPDLVIVWHSGRGAEYLNKLEALGLTVYASNPHTLDDIPRSIRDYGKLTGNVTEAERRATAFTTQYQKLKMQYRESRAVKVLYQVWNDPLQTLNGQHIVSDVIRLCGGFNIFAEEPSIAPKISIEAVIARNPEVIIASGMGEQKPQWLDDWRRFPQMRAVKRDNLYFVHPDLIQRHTPRMLLGAEQMCHHLQDAREKNNTTEDSL